MGKFKKVIAVLLTIMVLVTSLPLSVFALDSTEEVDTGRASEIYEAGDIIEFGSYPQSKVTDEDILSSLNDLITDKEWLTNGSAERQSEIQYIDIEYSGDKYRAIKFSYFKHEYSGYTDMNGAESTKHYQEINGYLIDTIYWFKYEPIKWRVLDPETGLIICQSEIDAKAYNDSIYEKDGSYYGDEEYTYYAADYSKCTLRSWLNNEFYNTAFSTDEQSNIKTTYIKNQSCSTNDKVFIPSTTILSDALYGYCSILSYSDRMRSNIKISDYAYANGCYTDAGSLKNYWLVQDPEKSITNAVNVTVNKTGIVSLGCLYAACCGVIPAITVDFIKDEKEKIEIEKDKVYGDTDFIQYGSQCFYDSYFEYSNNGMVAYNSNNTTTIKLVDKDDDCPTYSNKMMEIETTGYASRGVGGYHQTVAGECGSVFYQIIIAKIPKGYRINEKYNTLYYDAKVEWLTSTEGTDDWEIYIVKVSYGVNIAYAIQYDTKCGFIYLTGEEATTDKPVKWYVGYSNVFNNMGTKIYSYGNFANDNCSVGTFNNNSSASNTVSWSRISASSDCPTTSGYMIKIQTVAGTSCPGLGGFVQKTTPVAGMTYYHKMLAKVPVGYKLEMKSNAIDGDFEWETSNLGTGDWETYIYKLTVSNNATSLDSFGYVALYPSDYESGDAFCSGIQNIDTQGITISESVAWYLSYSNVFKNYEFSSDLNASSLTRTSTKDLNGHIYVCYDYPVSWHMAKNICEKLGGHLATITSADENSTISSMMTASKYYYWLGGTDEQTEGTWKWIDSKKTFWTGSSSGTASGYKNWTSGEPNDYVSNEDYLEMSTTDGYWNDSAENYTSICGFICEFDNDYIPMKTVGSNGHYYSLFKELLTWTEAEAYCEKLGGHLVTITSEEEQKLVESMLPFGINRRFYIGATDKDTEGTWKWIDTGETFWIGRSSGTAYGYANWNTGEPNNNDDSAEEDYAQIYNNSSFGKWNDTANTNTSQIGFICEFDTSTVEPDYCGCYGGNKYELYNESLTWFDAEEYAESKGGHLVTITSENEQKFIESVVYKGTKTYYYIGSNNYNPTHTWEWVTDEDWNYTNWNTNQPDFGSGREYFGMIYREETAFGKWNDCTNVHLETGFIIEYEDYYSNVSYDENNGSPINYFVAPTTDDCWTQNDDGTLSTTSNGVTVIYNPTDETFAFDSNGVDVSSASTSRDCILFSCGLPKQVKENQYLTLTAEYISGNSTMSNIGSFITFESSNIGYDGSDTSRKLSQRCATDIRISEGVVSNSTYPAGPFSSEQAQNIDTLYVWIYIPTGSTVKFDNYKLKFSANITDEPIETYSYSNLSKKIKSTETYADLLYTPLKTGYDFVNWKYNEQNVTADTKSLTLSNHTLTAEWELHPYVLTLNANGGTCEKDSINVYYQQPYGELPVPTREGYVFLGWYTKKKSGTVINPDDIYKKASDSTVYACWAKGENQICGDNVSWNLVGNKLVISGTGNMSDYEAGNAPWSSVSNYINSVEIQSGVTGIGNYAFYNMTGVKSVSVADTVVDFGEGAFENCMFMESIKIPENVKKIEEDTFRNCITLTEISFPYSVEEIMDGSFDGCNNLSKITVYNPKCVLPESIMTTNENVSVYGYTNSTVQTFANENDFTFVSIGTYGEQDNVLWIFTNATEQLSVISEGVMPDYLTNSVPWRVVNDKIKNVVFSDNITYIGNNSLYDCVNVSKITFPSKLNSLGENVLESTKWFENFESGIVVVKSILYAYKAGIDEDNVVLSKGITSISNNFSNSFVNGVDSPVSMQISDTVVDIGEKALAYATSLTSLTVNSGNKYYKTVKNVLYSKDGKKLLCYPAGLDGKFEIPQTVAEISPYAFAGCSKLTEIAIGTNVTKISDSAFEDTGLTKIYGYTGSYAESFATEFEYEFVPYTSTVTLDCNDGVMNSKGENIFNYNEYLDSLLKLPQKVYNNGELSYSRANKSITVSTPDGNESDDVYTNYYPDWFYAMQVEPNTTYELTFDVETSGNSNGGWQIYLFTDFDVSGDQIVECGDTYSTDSSLLHRAVHQTTFVFTTGEKANSLKIRFGNKDADDFSSTFSNIQIRKKLCNITTQNISVETGAQIGELPIPTYDGYIFSGWYLETDDDDILIDSKYIVNNDIILYAYWEEVIPEVPHIIGISIKTNPKKTDYFVGDSFDSSGLVITAQYSNGTTKEIESGFYCVPSKFTSDGNQNVIVTYSGFTTELNVNVTKVLPSALTIVPISEENPNGGLPDTLVYYVDQSINTKGLRAIVTYNNGTQKLIKNSSEFEYIYDFSIESDASTVTVRYEESGVTVETFYQVKVLPCPTICTNSVVCNAGEEINIPVSISNNSGLMGYIIYVHYDKNVLTPDNPYSNINGQLRATVVDSDSGLLKVIWYNTGALTDDRVLFTVPFNVNNKASTGDYEISFTYEENDTFDGDFNNVKLNCESSTIHIDSVEAGPTLYSENVQGYSDEYIDIPIYFSKNCGFNKWSILNIDYDTNEFSYVSCTDGIGTIIAVTDGKTIIFNELINDIENGTLITLRFKVSNSASGNYNFTMSFSNDKWSTESFVVNVQKVNTATYIKADDVTASLGDTVIIPVKISNNTGIMGYNIKFTYNESNLTFVNAEPSSTWDGNFEYNAQDGVINIVWNSSENITDDGDFIYLTFKAREISNPGTYNIGVEYVQSNTYNENWQNVNLTCQPISVTLSRKQLIKAVDNSSTNVCNDERIVCGLKPNLDDLSEYIEAETGYTYSVNKSSSKVGTGSKVNVYKDDELIDTYNVVIYGDVNGDGWYDGQDSLIVQCIMYGMLTKEQVGDAVWEAADCNHDNVIDQSDVDMLNQAGLLLANVDQSKTSEEMLINSSSYMDYLTLVSQNEADITDDESLTDADSSDNKNQDEEIVKSDSTIAVDWIRKIFLSIIKYIKEYFVLVK